jgi:hypothetical protein
MRIRFASESPACARYELEAGDVWVGGSLGLRRLDAIKQLEAEIQALFADVTA